MITRDYLLRMIHQLANVLAAVLRLTKVKQYDAAAEEVQATAKQLLGMDLRMLTTLSDAEFIRLLSVGERFDVEKCVVIAGLLKILGDVRHEQAEEEEARRVRLTAVSMFLELSRREAGALPREYHEEVEKLIETLLPFGIPIEFNKKLFGYYESVGRFDKAENILFDIVEEEVSFIEDGMKFYDRLRTKSNEELERGNLLRNEIEASVADLLKRAGTL